jgi:hypothetical protein
MPKAYFLNSISQTYHKSSTRQSTNVQRLYWVVHVICSFSGHKVSFSITIADTRSWSISLYNKHVTTFSRKTTDEGSRAPILNEAKILCLLAWMYGVTVTSSVYPYDETLTLSMKDTWPKFYSLMGPAEKVRMISQLSFGIPEFGPCLHDSICGPDDPQYFVLRPKPCKLTHSTDDGHRPHCAAIVMRQNKRGNPTMVRQAAYVVFLSFTVRWRTRDAGYATMVQTMRHGHFSCYSKEKYALRASSCVMNCIFADADWCHGTMVNCRPTTLEGLGYKKWQVNVVN